MSLDKNSEEEPRNVFESNEDPGLARRTNPTKGMTRNLVKKSFAELLRTPGRDRMALRVLNEGLQAKQYLRIRRKNGNKWEDHCEEKEDYATQFKFLELYLNYVEGQPIKRQEIISHTVSNERDLMEQAKTSPAFRDAMRRLLANADAEADEKAKSVPNRPKKGAKELEVVDGDFEEEL